jgi:Large polyvalent protein-associated domain 7
VDNPTNGSENGKPSRRRARAAELPENSIEPGRARANTDNGREASPPDNEIGAATRNSERRAPSQPSTDRSSDVRTGRAGAASETQWGPESVPLEVRERYVRLERKYFLENGDEAFRDHGSKLTTRSENVEIIRDMVKIAASRYDGEITVSGSDTFRRTVWQEAQLANIVVRGYSPTRDDEAELVRTIARSRSAARDNVHAPPPQAPESPPSRAPEVPDPPTSTSSRRSEVPPARADRVIFGELAAMVRRFVRQMPPARTEQEWLTQRIHNREASVSRPDPVRTR